MDNIVKKLEGKTVIKIIILCIFMLVVFVTGFNHEPWADEAQAWLIARDCSCFDIIFKICKYEGTPALWHLILKFLQFMHFPYKYLFVIPWIAGSISVYLILFRAKLPDTIKFIFPFTYYILYQYSVIARNHSLYFLMLSIIGTFYPKRLSRPYQYAILLMILASVSAYGFIMAFVLAGFFAIDFYKKYKYKLNSYIPLILVLVFMVITAITVFPPADSSTAWGFSFAGLNPSRIIFRITDAYFNTNTKSVIYILEAVLVIALYIFAGKTFCKNKSQTLFFILINLSLAVSQSLLYCNFWHSGYIVLTFIFTLWILACENPSDKINLRNNLLFYITLLFLFSVQILWSVKSVVYDLKDTYCASGIVAKFIKENNLTQNKIIGLGFHIVAIQPYFEKNIFNNLDTSYWNWNKQAFAKYMRNSISSPPPLTVITYEYERFNYPLYWELTEARYKKYSFKGRLFVKGEEKEDASFSIYVSKE